jgi:hypothetical protein
MEALENLSEYYFDVLACNDKISLRNPATEQEHGLKARQTLLMTCVENIETIFTELIHHNEAGKYLLTIFLNSIQATTEFVIMCKLQRSAQKK